MTTKKPQDAGSDTGTVGVAPAGAETASVAAVAPDAAAAAALAVPLQGTVKDMSTDRIFLVRSDAATSSL